MTHRVNLTPKESYALAQQLAGAAEYEEAIAHYSSALDGNPNHIQARCGRGLAFQRMGEHCRAIADFDHVISCNPDWSGAFVAYYSRAVSRYELSQPMKVIEDCDQAISRNPQFIDALYLRGTVQKSLGQIEAAMRDMSAVLNLDPNYHVAYCVRGGLYYLQQGWMHAIDDLTAAIELGGCGADHIWQCFYIRGMAAQELGNHSDAIADFTRTIALAPNDSGSYLRRSHSYRELGEFELADADVRIGTRLGHS